MTKNVEIGQVATPLTRQWNLFDALMKKSS